MLYSSAIWGVPRLLYVTIFPGLQSQAIYIWPVLISRLFQNLGIVYNIVLSEVANVSSDIYSHPTE
jgi:hypothetical protein